MQSVAEHALQCRYMQVQVQVVAARLINAVRLTFQMP